MASVKFFSWKKELGYKYFNNNNSVWWDCVIAVCMKAAGKTYNTFKTILDYWYNEWIWYEIDSDGTILKTHKTVNMPWGYIRRTVGELEEFLDTFNSEWGSKGQILEDFEAIPKTREIVHRKTGKRLFKCSAITGNRKSRGSSSISHAGLFFDEFLPDKDEQLIKKWHTRFPMILSDLSRKNKVRFKVFMAGNNNQSRSEHLGKMSIDEPKNGGIVELKDVGTVIYYEEPSKNLGGRSKMKNTVFKMFSRDEKIVNYFEENGQLDNSWLKVSWNEIEKHEYVYQCGVVIEDKVYYLITDYLGRKVWIHDLLDKQYEQITYYTFNQKDHAQNQYAIVTDVGHEMVWDWWEQFTTYKSMFVTDMVIFDILYEELKTFVNINRLFEQFKV